jgi:hypothetical protein
MPGDRTLRSLDASHAIPTRVLRFEVAVLRRRTPVRPVLTTGQTGTHRSDRSDPPTRKRQRARSLEKRKRKETNKKKLQQAIGSQTKAKSKIT